jgi:hypothetical protein
VQTPLFLHFSRHLLEAVFGFLVGEGQLLDVLVFGRQLVLEFGDQHFHF